MIFTQAGAALLQALLGLLEHVRFAAAEGVERRRAVRGAGNDSGQPCAGIGPSRSFEDSELVFVVDGRCRARRFYLCGNQCIGCTAQALSSGTDIATLSSRRRIDGVEDDATIQHERAVKC